MQLNTENMYLVAVECFIYVAFQYMTCAICFKCISDKHMTDECCPNYYKVNGDCIECPAGTFGLNCSAICPKNYYGQFCEKKCNCLLQYCNPVEGCNFTTYGDEIPCIHNYYILNGNCTECPEGTFGVNCSNTCPPNYFGRLCKKQCNCSNGQYCDPTKGCVFNNNGRDNGKTIAPVVTTECPDGTSGVNCKTTCPTNYNGHLCNTTCNCSIDQFCDIINGCLQKERDTQEENTVTSKITTAIRPRTSKWKNISFALIGVVLTVLVAAGLFHFRSRLKIFQEHRSFSNTEENQGGDCLANQNNEVANLGNPTHSTHGCASEERREEFSSVYDDLRSSQMIDRNSAAVNNFATCSQEALIEGTSETKYGSVSKPYDLNLYTETNGEEYLANNYEHFQIPTEYSILSLKRNIDPSVIELYGQRDGGKDGTYDLLVGQFHNISESSENSQSESESEACLSITKAQK